MNLWLETDRQTDSIGVHLWWYSWSYLITYLAFFVPFQGDVCVRFRSCWWVMREQLLGCIAESVTTDEEREREREKSSGTQVTDLLLIFFAVLLIMIKIQPLHNASWKTVPCQLVGTQMWASYYLAIGGSWSQACNYEFLGDCWFADSHELRSDIATVWRRFSVVSRCFERLASLRVSDSTRPLSLRVGFWWRIGKC